MFPLVVARQGGAAGEDARAREWALVRALGELRGAPPDGAYLAALARAGSWVRLLAEADTQAYPLHLARPALGVRCWGRCRVDMLFGAQRRVRSHKFACYPRLTGRPARCAWCPSPGSGISSS